MWIKWALQYQNHSAQYYTPVNLCHYTAAKCGESWEILFRIYTKHEKKQIKLHGRGLEFNDPKEKQTKSQAYILPINKKKL
jgi:hypothetical protein